jgi:hypothetical protein
MYYLKRDLILKDTYNQSAVQLKNLPPLTLKTSLKKGLRNKTSLLPAAFYLEMVSGQKPIGCRVKNSSANYKVRKGDIIGWQVTLREKQLKYFLKKWTNFILPIEGNINKVMNLSSFLELNEQILPEKLHLHISFKAKSPQISNLILSGYNIPTTL